MNKKITKLFKKEEQYGDNRSFRVFFIPDVNHEDWAVGMSFTVSSVNRSTGEVRFQLELDHNFGIPTANNE